MTGINIATYNLRNGGNSQNRIHYAKLFEIANPDITLFQETCPPEQYLTSNVGFEKKHNSCWAEVGETGWGSTVYVKRGTVIPISVPSNFVGSVVGVEIQGIQWKPLENRILRVFSIHAPDPYRKSVNEVLDFISTVAKDDDLIIGGDFNLTVGVRHPGEDRQDQDLWLLERLRQEFGLMSCWQAANPNRDLPQTLRWSGNPTAAYHCDGIFAPGSWYRYLSRCEVLSTPEWTALSDHNPVVASFT